MLRTKQLIKKFEDTIKPDSVSLDVQYTIHKVDDEQHLVTGVVYSPFTLDAHGHYMSVDEVRKTAHSFLTQGLQKQVDVMHDNEVIDAVVVESYVLDTDTSYAPAGSWIATTKINDPAVWKKIKRGQLNGYSMEIKTYTIEHEAEIEFDAWVYGETQPHSEDGHTHFYLVKMDSAGNVAQGFTGQSGTDGHTHTIKQLSVTDITDTHTHRIIL